MLVSRSRNSPHPTVRSWRLRVGHMCSASGPRRGRPCIFLELTLGYSLFSLLSSRMPACKALRTCIELSSREEVANRWTGRDVNVYNLLSPFCLPPNVYIYLLLISVFMAFVGSSTRQGIPPTLFLLYSHSRNEAIGRGKGVKDKRSLSP